MMDDPNQKPIETPADAQAAPPASGAVLAEAPALAATPPAHPSVGDDIPGLGVAFGVRLVRDDGCYVQIGSIEAGWVKL